VTSPAIVTHGTTAIAEGTCVINANQAVDVHYNAAPQAQQSFGVVALKVIYLPLVIWRGMPIFPGADSDLRETTRRVWVTD
jgi:hypothetical protein